MLYICEILVWIRNTRTTIIGSGCFALLQFQVIKKIRGREQNLTQRRCRWLDVEEAKDLVVENARSHTGFFDGVLLRDHK
jgi:hypothetical protein